MLSYEATMRIGRNRYQDVLDLLAGAGLSASFTQTGGMCAALEITLTGTLSAYELLVCDEDDTLSWDRAEHRGWSVGLYPTDHANEGGECLAFDSTPDGSPAALLPLVHRVLAGAPSISVEGAE